MINFVIKMMKEICGCIDRWNKLLNEKENK